MPRLRFARFHFLCSMALSFLALFACSSEQAVREIALSGGTMGTTYHIKCLAGPGTAFYSEDGPQRLLARVEERLKFINSLMSTYQKDSEISRFNASPSTDPFPVSPQTLRVLLLAQEVSEMSGGAFDITVGPLVNAFGFGAESKGQAPPTDEELARLRERVGYHLLTIDEKAGTVSKKRADVYCDLAAIAKGYGVDQVAELIEGLGFSDYMVEIGGEVRARGRNPRGVAWRIGVERPMDDGHAIQRVIHLYDVSVATSGDYRNFYMKDGKRLSHTIDPRTGRPIEHHLASTTVVDPECARADALATACMVLGPEGAMEFAERAGLSVLLLVREGDSRFNESESTAFRRWEEAVGKGAPGAGEGPK